MIIKQSTIKSNRRTIVISAVNLTNGGTLSILKDCLSYASHELTEHYKLIALVHDKALFDVEGIDYIEFPKSKKSWLLRLYYEWFHFKSLSTKLKPFLWLSLHDMTPRVNAERLAVYCHNPSPFYQIKLEEAFIDPKFALFNMLYSFIYKINIDKNDWVIVQQEWLRKEFFLRYPIRTCIRANPAIPQVHVPISNENKSTEDIVFFFPTLSRFFKNIEIIGEASSLLNKAGYNNFVVQLTIDGTENKYARKIFNRYSDIPQIKFIGLQPRERVFEIYEKADCLIFPSKLETWGLPLSEFKLFDKAIIAADLPYAHETVGQYDKVKFFDPNDANMLAKNMIALLEGQLQFDSSPHVPPAQPFAGNWDELFNILLGPTKELGVKHAE